MRGFWGREVLGRFFRVLVVVFGYLGGIEGYSVVVEGGRESGWGGFWRLGGVFWNFF